MMLDTAASYRSIGPSALLLCTILAGPIACSTGDAEGHAGVYKGELIVDVDGHHTLTHTMPGSTMSNSESFEDRYTIQTTLAITEHPDGRILLAIEPEMSWSWCAYIPLKTDEEIENKLVLAETTQCTWQYDRLGSTNPDAESFTNHLTHDITEATVEQVADSRIRLKLAGVKVSENQGTNFQELMTQQYTATFEGDLFLSE